MNVASVVVLIVLLALAGFAVWRNIRKGVPCSCGRSRGDCGCGCGDACRCHER